MNHAALIVSADPTTLDQACRLAAAADVEVAIARTADQAMAAWWRAPLVLVGADLAVPLARESPPRRPGVLVLLPVGRDDGGGGSDGGIGGGSGDRSGGGTGGRKGAGDRDGVYRAAVELGAQDVIALADAQSRLIDTLASAAEPAAGRALTVAVVGGRGGAGASVLAAGLAVTAGHEGLGALLVDGDPMGGGLDLLLGCELAGGARWPDLTGRRGRLSGAALSERLPGIGDAGPRLLSWDRGDGGPIPEAVMRSVLTAALGRFDLLLVDLPRSLEPAAVREALTMADVVLLVVPTELRAVAAAGQVARGVLRHAPDVRVVVRRTAPGDLVASEVAEAVDLPLAGVMDTDRRLPAVLDRGDLAGLGRRGPLPGACSRLLAGLHRSGVLGAAATAVA